MQILPIINQVGPLPQKTQFNAPMDGPAILVVTGSLWSQSPNVMLTMSIQLDGASIATAQIFSNGASTHRAFSTQFIGVNLSYGPHTLALVPGANTVSDVNDTFAASLIF